MPTLAANTALTDGVAPDQRRTRSDFPYSGPPFSTEERSGLLSLPFGARRKATGD